MQRLPVELVQERSKVVAKGIPAGTGRSTTAQQPTERFGLGAVAMPGGGTVLTALGFVKNGAEQKVGAVGKRTGAGVALPQGAEVEASDGLIDASGEMVGVEALAQFEASRVVVGPRR